MQVYSQHQQQQHPGYYPIVRPTLAVQGANGVVPTQMEVFMQPAPQMYQQWAAVPPSGYSPQQYEMDPNHQLIPLVIPGAYNMPPPPPPTQQQAYYNPYQPQQPSCHLLPPAYVPQAQVPQFAHKQLEQPQAAAYPAQQQQQQVWNNRYVPISLLGSGTYGQVYKCTDLSSGQAVAVKVSNREAAYRRSALAESNVLTLLRECDNVAVILDTFEDNGHVCIATEMLELNFLDLMKSRKGKPLSLANLAHVASNVLNTLSVMHSCGYMHCDVKPENVMLRSKKRGCKSTCLIDYGAVRRLDDNNYHDIQSLWYRAPEVICNGAYTTKIDVWSVGCLLFELGTGSPIFSGSDVKDQLQKIMACMGSPSLHLCQCATLGGHTGMTFAPGARDHSKSLIDDKIRLLHHNESPTSVSLFLDLIYRLLACDPDSRMSAADALRHPFLYTEEDPSPMLLSAQCSSNSTPCNLLNESSTTHGASLSFTAPMGVSASSQYMDPINLDGHLTNSGVMVAPPMAAAAYPPQYTYDMMGSPIQGPSAVTYVGNGWSQQNQQINSPQLLSTSFSAGQFEIYV